LKIFHSVVVVARCSARSLVQLWIGRVFWSEFWFGRLLLHLWLCLPTQIATKEQPMNAILHTFALGKFGGCWEKFVHLKNQKHLVNREIVLVVMMAKCGARSPLCLWILSVLWANFGRWVFALARFLLNLWFTLQKICKFGAYWAKFVHLTQNVKLLPELLLALKFLLPEAALTSCCLFVRT